MVGITPVAGPIPERIRLQDSLFLDCIVSLLFYKATGDITSPIDILHIGIFISYSGQDKERGGRLALAS